MNVRVLKATAYGAVLCLAAIHAAAQSVDVVAPVPGSATRTQGLEAFARMYEVMSHPRCSNCHVGPDNRPMWSGPSYGRTRPHGMNVNAGDSRIGAEYIPCATCHSRQQIDMPHTAPAVADDWRLAPVEFEWFDKTAPEICGQLRDPARNGDRTFLDIAAHLDHDVILHWAWTPGGRRESAPRSLREHVDDVLIWGAAGMPCPAS